MDRRKKPREGILGFTVQPGAIMIDSRRNVLRLLKRCHDKHGDTMVFFDLAIALEHMTAGGSIPNVTPRLVSYYVTRLMCG